MGSVPLRPGPSPALASFPPPSGPLPTPAVPLPSARSCREAWGSSWEPELSPRVAGKAPRGSFPCAWDRAVLGTRPGGI